MKAFAKSCLAVAVAAACPWASAADVEEVIVTASPFAKTAEAVSKPVNLLSGEDLQAAAAATLGETLSGQLGVSSASFGPGVGLPIIRGQSDNRVKVMQDSVGSMDASAASPDHAVTLEPLLANKIEVLRGPSALRYGSGAIGGVVNVLDNRIPTALPEATNGGIELRHASVNDENVGVANLNSSLGPVALHLDAIERKSNNLDIPGYAQNHPQDPEASTHGYIANTDATSNSGSFGASYIGEQGFIGASINKLDNNYGVPPDGEERVRIDMQQTRYDLKGELNNPFSGFEKISARLGHNDYQHTEMENGEAGTQFSNNAYEGRVELIHSPLEILASQWNGAIGLQTAQSTFAANGEEAFIPKSDIDSLGFFILEESQYNNWEYEVGVRSERQKIAPDTGSAIAHTSNNISASTTWNFSKQQKISLGLAQSQRAPSVEELLADGPHPATGSYLIGDVNLKEETSSNIELGYHWHNDKIEFSTNLFYNRINDFIYAENLDQIIDDLDGYQYTQDNAIFKGFETELKIALDSHWNLRLFGDKVRATLSNGDDLPRITPMRVGSSVDFAFKQWNANLSLTHSAKQEHPGANESETQSYNRVDARIDYTFANRYTLFLKANNLLDSEIRNASSYLRDIAPEAGRNIQLGVRLTF
ncbi:MAG TPA: TonB-dependent receptor [Cellvibrio sp.]|nr:TonB-dependent receptor [Cellvibrio sp.]